MQPSPFTTQLAQEHAADLRERALEQRGAAGASATRRPGRSRSNADARPAGIALRVVDADDDPAVRRLAALDERPMPTGSVLLADVEGRPRAALAFRDGKAIADPFFPTAELVALLRLRAAQLRAEGTRPRWRRRGRLLARVVARSPLRTA
jgi:hypothetical protein